MYGRLAVDRIADHREAVTLANHECIRAVEVREPVLKRAFQRIAPAHA